MPRDQREDFKEMELWEHLSELRSRLIRAAFYVVLGLVGAWAIYPWLWSFFVDPLHPILKNVGGRIVYDSIFQGFLLRLQVSLIAGLVLAIPLVTLEAWGFIAPGLTRAERRACYLVFPASLVFFFMGVACGYALIGVTLQYFSQFIPSDVEVLQNPVKYITFMVKMVVAFGLCFQLPIILMFLAWIGLVTSKTLREQWRMAVVGCFVVAALATPGGDPVTMSIMAAPLALLYLASIGLCTVVERVRRNREKREAEEEAAQERERQAELEKERERRSSYATPAPAED